VRIHRLSAFSEGTRGGNPAGVVLPENIPDESTMQKIAKDVGYSETAFFLPSKKAPYRLRFFTPTTEVPLCGHASVAAFNLLRDLGDIKISKTTFETDAGILEIHIEKDKVFLELAPPAFHGNLSKEPLAEILRIPEENITHTPHIVSTGIKEVFLGVDSLKTLAQAKPDRDALIDFSARYDVKGVYLFTLETAHNISDAQGRNFLPSIGIDEESATGTAAGALAYYFHRFVESKTEYLFEQGHTMRRPSALHVKLKEQSGPLRIFVGGEARVIA